MIVTRKSPFSGIVHEQDIDITSDQLKRWQRGGLIQNVMPHLTADEREFIMTGITKSEWAETFGDKN